MLDSKDTQPAGNPLPPPPSQPPAEVHKGQPMYKGPPKKAQKKYISLGEQTGEHNNT